MPKLTVGKKLRNICKLTFAVYLLILLKLVFFKHPFYSTLESIRSGSGGVVVSMNLVPFATILNYFKGVPHSHVAIENLLGNILLFLPFGMFLPILWKRTSTILRVLTSALIFSLLLEICQLTLHIGSFDVDDLILNTLGALIGYVLFKLLFHLPENHI